jgi:hypothetical protein
MFIIVGYVFLSIVALIFSPLALWFVGWLAGWIFNFVQSGFKSATGD